MKGKHGLPICKNGVLHLPRFAFFGRLPFDSAFINGPLHSEVSVKVAEIIGWQMWDDKASAPEGDGSFWFTVGLTRRGMTVGPFREREANELIKILTEICEGVEMVPGNCERLKL